MAKEDDVMIRTRVTAELHEQMKEVLVPLRISTTTYLRLCVMQLVAEQGIPFHIKLNK